MKISRNSKRSIIIGVYVILLIFFGVWLFYVITPKPHCFDGKQNQKEDGIDCGGPCTACMIAPEVDALHISEAHIVFGGAQLYDVVARVENPNDDYGSARFDYTLLLTNDQGITVAERSGTSFILPLQGKYLVATNIELAERPQSITVRVDNVVWEKFQDYEAPQLTIRNKKFDYISGGTGFGEAFGIVRNESPFDFSTITVTVILRDAQKIPLAVNTTEMRTVTSGEEREFRLRWPVSFPGDVRSVDVDAEANVFSQETFLNRYLPGGRFQDLQQDSTTIRE
ncbi:hypothetical protein A2976_00010 [candidate division WWE3 bacterium RIFCSPLOWO2_01_FULL_41_9]|uniref:Uncharacterized protein n=1 Tax=candidate division WWE3 bacterium RIFCSPLOWO2_01_FULL_41_9 TaxID=1802626 RepID=A0A1F4VHS9_UNCKA|nr:MAG: hypothetical protein A2976_00010 [candidate division WWE3 bacterium RIFCSPLOWO2_01_FULL_41_9]